MVKCAKIQLYYVDDERLEFGKAQEALWQIQRETRAAANRAIQMSWEMMGFESDWKRKNGEYPTAAEIKSYLPKSFQTVIYDRAKEDAPNLGTQNLSSVLQMATSRFAAMKRDILCGNVTIPSFKKDIPIYLHKKSLTLLCVKDEESKNVKWYFKISLFSKAKKTELGLDSCVLMFKAVVPAKRDKYLIPIIERCYTGEYTICGSQLKYEDGRWFLLLSYSFENTNKSVLLDKDNVMGVHIAEANAVTCVFNNSTSVLRIDGGEIPAFTAQIEKRRRSIGKASRKHSDLCGDGRIGHGYHAKMKPLEYISDKVTNFRNTVNHRYSRQIVNWAVQNGCGTIQIEDLTGFATNELDKYKFMQSWSYYDLMCKIESKAKEYGIEVIKLPYAALHKWCTTCGEQTVERNTLDTGVTECVCSKCGEKLALDALIQRAVAVPHIADKLKKSKDAA